MDNLEELKDVKARLVITEADIEILKYNINKLLLDEKVKEYIRLQYELKKLNDKKIKLATKKKILKQNMCNHELVWFNSIYYKRLKYNPSFTCLNCGKEINRFLYDNQTCINEDHIYETRIGAFGDSVQETDIFYRYDKLKKQGLSIDEIKDTLLEEISKMPSKDNKVKIKVKINTTE